MTKIYPLEIKLAAVNEYLDGGDSIRVIAKKYGVSKTMLHRWVTRFENHGKDGLQVTYTNYSFEFKMDVLKYMNEVGASIEEATAVFNISSSGLVGKWKLLAETKGIDALKPSIKERPSMKKLSKKTQPVEGSEEALRAEIEYLRMENAYLKKLKALIQEKEKLQSKTKRK
jgi:transposase-like protein